MPIKHTFVSQKSDDPDVTLVNPSDWNANHDVDMSINELSDVNIASPLDGDVLVYDNATSKWVSGSGTDSDAIHDNVASEIHSVAEKTTPVDNDELLIEDSSDSYKKKRVKVSNLPSGGVGFTESRIGLLTDVLGGGLLSAKEAMWVRVIALADVTLTKVQAAISAVGDDIRVRVLEVNSGSGNPVVDAVTYNGSYQAVSAPEFAEFSGLSISLTKNKIYAVVIEVETGATLQMYQNQTQLGYGSLLPSTTNLGGYCSRDVGVGGTLSSYSSSLPIMWLTYE